MCSPRTVDPLLLAPSRDTGPGLPYRDPVVLAVFPWQRRRVEFAPVEVGVSGSLPPDGPQGEGYRALLEAVGVNDVVEEHHGLPPIEIRRLFLRFPGMLAP